MLARARRAGLALLLACAACGPGAPGGLPRIAAPAGLDPLVLERVEAALAAAERDEPGARLELAKVYDANGLNELALATYELCLARGDEPRATLVFLRGTVLEALERTDEALAAYQEALRLGDTYAPTRWRAGQLLLDRGRLEEARREFEAALALEPRSIPALLGLARVELLAGAPEAALARLAPLAEAEPEERFVHGLLARALRALGQEEEARRALAREERAQRISLADPRSAEVRLRATGILHGLRAADEALGRGDARGAVTTMEALYARAPQDLAVQQMLAKALIGAGEHAHALEVLTASAAAHPDEFKTELFLGLAQQGQKNLKKAHEHLARAARLNPAYGPTHAALGEVEARFARFAAAETALLRALECGADELRTRILLAQVQLEQKAYARAASTADETRTLYPNAVAAWTYLAEARARLGETEAARLALAEAEKRNPSYERLPQVRALLATVEATPR